MKNETLNVPPCATKDGNNESDDENQPAMGYQQTIMYGTYSKALGDYAREQAKIQKVEDKQRKRKLRKDTGTSIHEFLSLGFLGQPRGQLISE